MNTSPLSPTGFLKLSQDVASFYGFRPLRETEKLVPSSVHKRTAHNFAYASASLAHSSAAPGDAGRR